MIKRLVAATAVAALALTACSGGTGAGTAGGSGGGGDPSRRSNSSRPSTRRTTPRRSGTSSPQTYKAKTGIDLDVQVVSWDDIDQQSSTMIQNNDAPDILNLNAYASYAKDGLLYYSDEVLSDGGEERHAATLRQERHLQGQDVRHAGPVLGPRAVLQQGPLRQGRHRRAAEDLGRVHGGRQEDHRARRRQRRLRRCRSAPRRRRREFSIWLFNNGGDWKTDGKWTINSAKNVETLTFLKKLRSTDKVTQNNPGKTNRTDGAFALFKSGKAGMVVGFSPLAGALDKDKKVDYGVAPMPDQGRRRAPQTYGVTDYLMAFKKPGNQDAVKAFYDLYYQPDQVNTFIKAEGFLPVTKTGVQAFSATRS